MNIFINLLILNLLSAQHKVEKNLKLKSSTSQTNTIVKASLDKIHEIQREIKNSKSLNESQYNELIDRYNKLLIAYELKKKNRMEENVDQYILLKKKIVKDYIYFCNRWKSMAQQFGLLYGKALYYLGHIDYINPTIRQRDTFYCTGSIYYNIVSRNRIHNDYKRCFYKEFQNQMIFTIKSLKEKKYNQWVLDNPYILLNNKEVGYKELENNIKHVLKDFGKYKSHVPRYYK